jgi:hypothetical protein
MHVSAVFVEWIDQLDTCSDPFTLAFTDSNKNNVYPIFYN